MNTKFLLSSDNNNRNELLKKKIIHYYIANGDATIADLGREMDLSIPTVTKLVAELQDDGYILDFGKQETNGGRKPNIYGLNPASGYFVGVDMLKDKLNIAAIDFKGDKVQLEENIPYQLEGGLCFGIGFGIFDANNMPILCQFVSPRYRATAYGIMNMTGVFAGAIITKLLGESTDAGNLGHDFAMMASLVFVALVVEVIFLRPRTVNMTDK